MTSANDALNKLKAGNRRFVNGDVEITADKWRHDPALATGQTPHSVIIACSDSRVPPEVVFDQGFGDLFVIRVAGNIVSPTQKGSVEYAVTELGVKLVVVLGHSNCGLVSAALRELRNEVALRSPNLRDIVDRASPVMSSDDTVEDAIRANIRKSMLRLTYGSQIIETLAETGDVVIAGAEYLLETGEVEFLD